MGSPRCRDAQDLGPLHILLAPSGFQLPGPHFPPPHLHPRNVEGTSLHCLHEQRNRTHNTDMTQASCRLLTRPWPAVSRQGERTSPPSSVSGGPGSQAQLPALRICSGRRHRTSVSRAPEPEVHERPWGASSWVRTQMWKPAFGKVIREGLDGEFSWRTWWGTHHG